MRSNRTRIAILASCLAFTAGAFAECDPGGVAIPDVATTLDFQTVAAGTIADVNVSVELTHTWVSDIAVFIQSPNLTEVQLWANGCGSPDNMSVTYDSDAGTSVGAFCPPTPGIATFATPLPNPAALDAFDGLNAGGTWRIRIVDSVGGDSGFLNQWCVNVTYVSSGATAAQVAAVEAKLDDGTSFVDDAELAGVELDIAALEAKADDAADVLDEIHECLDIGGGSAPGVYTPVAGASNFQSIIGGTSTLLAAVSTCDDCNTNVTLPFSFPFYCGAFPQSVVNVNSNGNLSLGGTTDSSFGLASIATPTAGAPFNRIHVVREDLHTGNAGDIWVRNIGTTSTIISWEGVGFFADVATNNLNAQVELFATGEIEIRYGTATMGANNVASGVVHPTGTPSYNAFGIIPQFNAVGQTTGSVFPTNQEVRYSCAAGGCAIDDIIADVAAVEAKLDDETNFTDDGELAAAGTNLTNVINAAATTINDGVALLEAKADDQGGLLGDIADCLGIGGGGGGGGAPLAGAVYDVVAASGTFTPIAGSPGAIQVLGLADDNVVGPFSFPFTLPWFDGTDMYSSYHVNSNGQVLFPGDANSYCCSNWSLDEVTAPAFFSDTFDRIPFCQEDIYPPGGGSVWRRDNGTTSTIISFENVPFFFNTGVLNAQVEIFATGDIEMRWGTANTVGNNISAGLKEDNYAGGGVDWYSPQAIVPAFSAAGQTSGGVWPTGEAVRFVPAVGGSGGDECAIDTILSKIDAVQASVDAIEAKADIFETKADTITADIANLDGDVAAVEAKADVLEAKADAIEAKADSIQSKVDSISAGVEDIASKVGAVQDSIDALEAKADVLEAKADTITSDIADLDADVAAIEAKADAIEAKADEIQSKVGTIATGIDDLATKVGAVQDSIDALEAKADVLEAKADDITSTVNDINSTVNDIEQDVAAVESKLDSFENGVGMKLDAISMAIDALEAKMDFLEAKTDAGFSSVHNHIDTSTTSILNAISSAETNILTAVAAVEAKLDAIEGKLDQSAMDIAALEAKLDAIETKLDNLSVQIASAVTTILNAISAAETNILTAIAAIEAKLDAIEAKLDAIEGKLDAIAVQIADALTQILARIDLAETNLTALIVQETDEIDLALDMIESKLDAIEVKLDAIEVQISDALAQILQAIADCCAAIIARIDLAETTILARIDLLESNLTTLIITETNEIDVALDAIEAKLDAIESKLDALQLAIDALESKLDAFIAEFRDFVELWCRLEVEKGLTVCDPNPTCNPNRATSCSSGSGSHGTSAWWAGSSGSGSASAPEPLMCRDDPLGSRRTSLFYTPQSVSPMGLFEKVVAVVSDVLAENALMGRVDPCADLDLQEALTLAAAGDYAAAYDLLCRAYASVTVLCLSFECPQSSGSGSGGSSQGSGGSGGSGEGSEGGGSGEGSGQGGGSGEGSGQGGGSGEGSGD